MFGKKTIISNEKVKETTDKKEMGRDMEAAKKAQIEQAKVIENNIKIKKKKEGLGLKVTILAILSFLLTALVVLLLIIMPKKVDEIRKLRTQSLAYRIAGQDEVLLVKSLKDNEERINKLMTSFPNETSLLSFIKMIEGLYSTEVKIEKFSIDSDLPTKIGKGSSFLPVSLTITGKEEKIDEVLGKIINMPYFIRVVNFSKEYDSDSEDLIAVIQFHLFVADEF